MANKSLKNTEKVRLKHPEEKEELELLKRIKRGEKNAQEKFIKMNQGLVFSIAKKYAFAPNTLDDLISEGNIGLLEAIKKFNPKKHTRFGTYAYFWIKRYIMRAIIDESFKVPEKIHKLKTKYKDIVQKIKMEKNRYPRDSEMSAMLNLDLEKFLKYKPYFESTKISPTFQDKEDENYDIFEITDFESSKKKWDRMLSDKDLLNRLFERLKKRNKRLQIDLWIKILKMHYGIDNGNPKTYKEIASELGITRQRVHQIVKNCLRYLNKEIKEMKNEKAI
ncbi:MAG: sigma-70 family RNA polymerase sigma factor [Candidatus Omnitrophica bacterium]|nr:sigma-70 family RNA polymerase sigma factor [Candidatus Omnitrophota bacterium]MCM8829330.1 sigma-70 family RNA polymerase sigma factor [Candidatus Omnitrophota bacterium]